MGLVICFLIILGIVGSLCRREIEPRINKNPTTPIKDFNPDAKAFNDKYSIVHFTDEEREEIAKKHAVEGSYHFVGPLIPNRKESFLRDYEEWLAKNKDFVLRKN